MQDYRKLRLWERAQQLCVEIHGFSAHFHARSDMA
jgi:hypothetical protein